MRRIVRAVSVALVGSVAACLDDPPTALRLADVDHLQPSSGLFSIGDLKRATPGHPCRVGAHRQFDFWLGEWDVEVPPGSGSLAGTNRIESEVDGCVIAEYWAGAGGLRGWSLNAYDPWTGKWNQHWVAEGGMNLRMSGGLVGNAIVMSGPRQIPGGGTVIDRTTWTPLGAGGLTQFWDISSDGGLTFPTVAFNGQYLSHPGVVPAPTPGSTLCTTPGYASADFMLGDWNVSADHGPDLGTSSITSELSHCLLVERFRTPKGYEWKGFLSFGRLVQRWFNTTVDSEGQRLELAGTGQPGSIVMTGSAKSGSHDVQVRLTYSQLSADGWTSTIETSRNDGQSWKVERVLVYTRAN